MLLFSQVQAIETLDDDSHQSNDLKSNLQLLSSASAKDIVNYHSIVRTSSSPARNQHEHNRNDSDDDDHDDVLDDDNEAHDAEIVVIDKQDTEENKLLRGLHQYTRDHMKYLQTCVQVIADAFDADSFDNNEAEAGSHKWLQARRNFDDPINRMTLFLNERLLPCIDIAALSRNGLICLSHSLRLRSQWDCTQDGALQLGLAIFDKTSGLDKHTIGIILRYVFDGESSNNQQYLNECDMIRLAVAPKVWKTTVDPILNPELYQKKKPTDNMLESILMPV